MTVADAGVRTPGTLHRVPNQPKTKARSFRVPDELYLPAQAKARERGETATDVVTRAFEDYLRDADPAPEVAERLAGKAAELATSTTLSYAEALDALMRAAGYVPRAER